MQIAIALYDRLHRARRHRPLRGAPAPARRRGDVRRRRAPARCATDNGMLALIVDAHASTSVADARRRSSCPAASARAAADRDDPIARMARAARTHDHWTTSVCTGSLLLGAAGCSTASTRPPTGARSTSSPRFGASPTGERVVHRRQGRHRGRACRPASTWRSRWPREIAGRRGRAGDPARRSSTTRSRRSTPARRPRPRPRCSSSSPPSSPPSARRRSPDRHPPVLVRMCRHMAGGR